MSYRNPMHGLDSDGHPTVEKSDRPMSGPADTLPSMTADSSAPRVPVYTHSHDGRLCCENHDPDAEDIQCCDDCPNAFEDPEAIDAAREAYDTFVLDLSYFTQPHLEALLVAGDPLPEGITPADVTGWREAHPDYDPAKPMNGHPMPEGVSAANLEKAFDGTDSIAIPVKADTEYEIRGRSVVGPHPRYALTQPVVVPDLLAEADIVLDAEVTDDGPASGRHPDGDPYTPYTEDDLAAQRGYAVSDDGEGMAVIPADDAEVVEPDARCAATTAAPLDRARRCPVHGDGAHRCYRGPGHQHATRTGPASEPRPDADGTAPEWARHWCDCGFAWADVVQPRVPRRDGQPTSADRFEAALGGGTLTTTGRYAPGSLDWNREHLANEKRREIGQ